MKGQMSDGLIECLGCGDRVDMRTLDDEGLCPDCALEKLDKEEQEDEENRELS